LREVRGACSGTTASTRIGTTRPSSARWFIRLNEGARAGKGASERASRQATEVRVGVRSFARGFGRACERVSRRGRARCVRCLCRPCRYGTTDG